MGKALDSIAIRGGGIAGWLAALALRTSLPDRISVTVYETPGLQDHLYGQILPPEFYPFHLTLDLFEPDLILRTSATFVYGTHYADWSDDQLSWTQVFHQPIPVWDGVELHRIIAATKGVSLQDTLIASAAAKAGRFAHPPEDPSHPLSRAEYGYAIDPADLAALYKSLATVAGVRTASGQPAADLVVDTLPPKDGIPDGHPFSVTLTMDTRAPLSQPVRKVSGTQDGWTDTVTTCSGSTRMTIASTSDHNVQPHTRPVPWQANAVAIGHAARLRAPISVAPMRLLLRDIERLLALVPVTTDMQVEAREYNAACTADTHHADLFDRAHIEGLRFPEGHVLADSTPAPDSLVRKLATYARSAYLTMYDREPFDATDWAILHDGVGRTPDGPGILARALDPAATRTQIAQLRESIASVITRMPPFPVYTEKFTDYLRRKHAQNG